MENIVSIIVHGSNNDQARHKNLHQISRHGYQLLPVLDSSAIMKQVQ
jgi:hypothetical protein